MANKAEIGTMQRSFFDFLRQRSSRARSVPLIVRGARQTGKSYAIRHYGSENFANVAELNFELRSELGECFRTLDASVICRELEALLRVPLIDGKSLLFIDEIQAAPQALKALRVFKEQRPGLDVIAAGSLLEFALDENILRSFPVGRAGFAWLHPLSFREFLIASGESALSEIITRASLAQASISKPVHGRLLELVRTYFVIGGMPEAVAAYLETGSYLEAKAVQSRLHLGYIADFVKYGRRYNPRHLELILTAAPRMVGKQFKFSHIEPTARARDLKPALFDLERSGLLTLVRSTSANGAPLGAEEKSNQFKIQMLDIGLMLNMLDLDLGDRPLADALFANEGALAEQFVGQELLAYAAPDAKPSLHYWRRDSKGSEAEVDFVITHRGRVFPIEVKAGATGTLRSARLFMKEKAAPYTIRISQHELSLHDGIISVPLYMCGEIPRLLDEVLSEVT